MIDRITMVWALALVFLMIPMGNFAMAQVDENQALFRKGVHQVDRALTFNQPVVFEAGAVLDIPAGVVVTFKEGFTAADELVFAGRGTISGVDHLVPEWFGAVGDGKTDDTLALQRTIDSFLPDRGFSHDAPKQSNKILLRKSYLVSSLTVNSTHLNIHADNAWLIAQPEGNHSHLIRFNRHFCSITGTLSIEGNYNLGYETMIHIRARHFIGNNIVIWRASLGWIFGDREWATSGVPGHSELGDSEIVISSSRTVHCLRAVEAIGSNTIIVFADCLTYSYPWSLPKDSPKRAAWEGADLTLVRSIGALIYFQGGQLANFNPRVPLVEVQPIRNTKPQYYSNYGGVGIFNAHIEAGNIFATANPHKIPTQDHEGNAIIQKFASLQLISCTGYATGNAIPIKADAMFTGTVIVQNCNFYGHPATTFAKLENPRATIKVDDISVYNKWTNGLSAIQGGTLFFSNRLIFEARQSLQTITRQGQDLAFTTPTLTGDTRRFQEYYNAQSGKFTVPAGGLNNVRLQVGVQWAGDDPVSGQFGVWRNGQEQAVQSIAGSAATMTYTFATLDEGDVISVKLATDADSRRLSGRATNYLQITADKY